MWRWRMAKSGVIVTGDKELDRALARMEAKAIKKLLPKAAKEAAQVSKKDYQRRVPVLTGAMRDAVVVRVRRYKHKEKTGTGRLVTLKSGKQVRQRRVTAEDIGAKVLIDRNQLTKKAGQKKRGRKSLPLDLRRGGMFFYPAVVELGNRKRTGKRPLTKALYDNETPIKGEFIKAMRRLVSNPK